MYALCPSPHDVCSLYPRRCMLDAPPPTICALHSPPRCMPEVPHGGCTAPSRTMYALNSLRCMLHAPPLQCMLHAPPQRCMLYAHPLRCTLYTAPRGVCCKLPTVCALYPRRCIYAPCPSLYDECSTPFPVMYAVPSPRDVCSTSPTMYAPCPSPAMHALYPPRCVLYTPFPRMGHDVCSLYPRRCMLYAPPPTMYALNFL